MIWLAKEVFDKLHVVQHYFVEKYSQGTAEETVAKQFSECGRRIAKLYDKRNPAVKGNSIPSHNSWLRACVACNNESRIGTMPLAPSDTSSMIVRIPFVSGFVLNIIRS
ncbi:hypothetical protein TNCV_3965121 [Trichonephila clavipes]|nr:hypothetical protein TNCV_3965121 [Trichonephila clavipes]